MYCQANGMDLFDISPDESKSTLLGFAVSLFGEGSLLYVKGRKAGECRYFSSEDDVFEALYGFCYQLFYFICGFKNQALQTSAVSS
jgi:hypothetical protein